jgi:hypothetical protein
MRMRISRRLAEELGIALPARPRVRQSSPDAMNRTERRYATEVLEIRRLAGEVLRWDFQSIKLRLADRTWYCPDFPVILADGTLEFHEIKGFWEDDARVKIKVAAELHPYRFVAVRWVKGGWETESFEGKNR